MVQALRFIVIHSLFETFLLQWLVPPTSSCILLLDTTFSKSIRTNSQAQLHGSSICHHLSIKHLHDQSVKNKQKHHCWCLRICESARYFIRPTSQASQASMAIVSLEASNTQRSCDFEGRDTPLISAWRSLSLETYGCSLKWLNCFTPTVSCRTRGTNRTGGWKLLPSAC